MPGRHPAISGSLGRLDLNGLALLGKNVVALIPFEVSGPIELQNQPNVTRRLIINVFLREERYVESLQ